MSKVFSEYLGKLIYKIVVDEISKRVAKKISKGNPKIY